MSTSFKALLLLGAFTFWSSLAHADDITTVTHTNYVTPDCFKTNVENILSNNPSGLTTGIPIVFVYANSGDDDNDDDDDEDPAPETVLSTSTFKYTVSSATTTTQTTTSCSNNKCNTALVYSVVPHTYTTTGQTVVTTTRQSPKSPAQTKSSTTKGKSTRYEYETDSVWESINETKTGSGRVVTTAQTTTKTVFIATSTPSTIYKGTTTTETITSTQPDPLLTGPVVSKSLTKSIEVSKITDGVTFSKASFSNSSALTNSSAVDPVIAAANTTSTIDLRVASSTASRKSTSSPGYSNATSHRSELESLSSGASSLSSAALSLTSLTSSLSSSSSSSKTSSSSSKASSSSSSSLSSKVSSQSAVETQAAAALSNSVCLVSDLFAAIDTSAPPSVFTRGELPLTIPNGVSNNGVPYETNKFYTNLILDDQTDMIWSYPYGLFWKTLDYYGFGLQHTNVSDRVFGSENTNNKGVDSYYYNPILNAELVISSTSFSLDSNHLFVTDLKSMSVVAKLSASSSLGSDYVEIPIVQGMGLVTAIYHGGLTARLNSAIGVSKLVQESSSILPSSTLKYRAALFSGVQWLIYVTLPDESTSFKLSAESSYSIVGSKSVDGLIIQVAVAPDDTSKDNYYDQAVGIYPVKAELEGSVSGCSNAQYGFKYTTEGTSASGKTLLFALPHHVESLTGTIKNTATGIKLSSTTKGDMYGYLTNSLEFSEALETSIGFLPWAQSMTKELKYTTTQLKELASAANSELAVDIGQTVQSVDSTYSSGKLIDKYAYILLVVNDIIQDKDVSKSTLAAMKEAFEPFLKNEQYYKLMYDTKFGGVTSTANNNGDTGADYGSGYYNDHHFHYGYYVHAAAIVGYVDKQLGGTWAEDNKDWVNSLVRDVANPSESDSYFPVSRMFDWFAGHSWASGLFSSGDGRNEESSSEDYNFAYGMKLWGNVIGDGAMEARGGLMLSVMSRAMNKYFYYKSDNTVEPSEIIANKVSGILFDNKIAYTTYFGTPADHPEYVHGIHMLPITPASSLIRIPSFVQEEWDDQISTFIGNVNSGWTGILRLNQALYDAKTSYEFFSSDSFSSSYLDNGQSRTWSLAFSGGVANGL